MRGSCASATTLADCGQPRPIGSFSGPSSSMETKSSTMKLRSSVVTTSSTPKRVLSTRRAEQQRGACSHGDEHDDRNEKDRRQRQRAGAEHDGHDAADIELRLGADVPELGAEGDGDGKAGEDQRRRAGQRLESGELRAGGTPGDEIEDREGRGASGEHQQRGDDQRRGDRAQRIEQRDGERRRGLGLKPHGWPRPPRHARPSVRQVRGSSARRARKAGTAGPSTSPGCGRTERGSPPGLPRSAGSPHRAPGPPAACRGRSRPRRHRGRASAGWRG